MPLSPKFPIDIKPFFYLIVQLTYLLYTCYVRKVNVYIGKEMLVRTPRKG